MLRLIVCGAGGRMGTTVVRLAQGVGSVKVVGAIEGAANPHIGKDAGEVAGVGKIGVTIAAEITPLVKGQIVIVEFSTPEATAEHARLAAQKMIPMVIGTTGLNRQQSAEIEKLARRTPILVSANMSLGVNLLVRLLGDVAKVLGQDYDVEIIEAHHHFKKDAPSGTALAMARSVAQALRRDLGKVAVNGRKGIVGERTKQEIAVLSVRAGDIVGDHTVMFGGIGERIEFIHRAHSRDTFAQGALRAAQWLAKQKAGLYSMQDVLQLK